MSATLHTIQTNKAELTDKYKLIEEMRYIIHRAKYYDETLEKKDLIATLENVENILESSFSEHEYDSHGSEQFAQGKQENKNIVDSVKEGLEKIIENEKPWCDVQAEIKELIEEIEEND